MDAFDVSRFGGTLGRPFAFFSPSLHVASPLSVAYVVVARGPQCAFSRTRSVLCRPLSALRIGGLHQGLIDAKDRFPSGKLYDGKEFTT
jgi:hypothetical protein